MRTQEIIYLLSISPAVWKDGDFRETGLEELIRQIDQGR